MKHNEIVAPFNAHSIGFRQTTDPSLVPANDVQPNAVWIEVDGSDNIVAMWIRNAANAAWEQTTADLSAYRTATDQDTIDAAQDSALTTETTNRIADVDAEETARIAAVNAEAAARITADGLLIPLTQKAAASGVATLDAGTKIPVGQIPDLDAAKITTGVLSIARLATGTPDGTKFVRDDGTLAVPAGGGGGGTFTYFDPDKPPASAHALDDEGNGTAGTNAAGFTGFSVASATLQYDGNGRIKISGFAADGDSARFFYKASPGSPVTITTKMTANIPSQWGQIGLAMMDSTTGKLVQFGIQNRGGIPYLSRINWNAAAPFSFNSEGNSSIAPYRTMYLQMRWNSPNLTMWYIWDGLHDWLQWEGNNTHLGNVDRIGVSVNGWGSSDPTGYFDFWRVKAATSYTIGGMRTVSGS